LRRDIALTAPKLAKHTLESQAERFSPYRATRISVAPPFLASP
jgi:hypothetical protein